MNKTEALAQLAAAGSEQTRKTYVRHGVRGDMYGVSYATLRKLTKQIKVDQQLAEELWATANHDARILATLVADPSRMTAGKLDTWAKELGDYVIASAFADFAAKSPDARRCMEKWMQSSNEWLATAGWGVFARIAAQVLDESEAEGYLRVIEAGIHQAKNRVRHAMNNALIGLGLRNARMQALAIAAARRIGKVEVDHGDTGCQTPDAVSYIAKAAAHRQAQEQKKQGKGTKAVKKVTPVKPAKKAAKKKAAKATQRARS